jgi:hypothetical protein
MNEFESKFLFAQFSADRCEHDVEAHRVPLLVFPCNRRRSSCLGGGQLTTRAASGSVHMHYIQRFTPDYACFHDLPPEPHRDDQKP